MKIPPHVEIIYQQVSNVVTNKHRRNENNCSQSKNIFKVPSREHLLANGGNKIFIVIKHGVMVRVTYLHHHLLREAIKS